MVGTSGTGNASHWPQQYGISWPFQSSHMTKPNFQACFFNYLNFWRHGSPAVVPQHSLTRGIYNPVLFGYLNAVAEMQALGQLCFCCGQFTELGRFHWKKLYSAFSGSLHARGWSLLLCHPSIPRFLQAGDGGSPDQVLPQILDPTSMAAVQPFFFHHMFPPSPLCGYTQVIPEKCIPRMVLGHLMTLLWTSPQAPLAFVKPCYMLHAQKLLTYPDWRLTSFNPAQWIHYVTILFSLGTARGNNLTSTRHFLGAPKLYP